MPMRVDCRNYESRTYANGEVVRKCRIDLAPEAPWRCPDDCPGFSRRMMDAGWQVGSLEKGKWADIIAVKGDPLRDINVLQHVSFVMKSGVVYKHED
jgi:hypothetical protein